MAQSLSSLSVSLPLSSDRSCSESKLVALKLPYQVRSNGGKCRTVKAMASDSRDNLDHLQRQSKNQSQPRRRNAPVAPIGLWDRFPTARTVQQMMDTMDSLMEDPLPYSAWAQPSNVANGSYRKGRTPWEIKDSENDYKMRFDMPGMSKEDVKVWVEEKMLVLKAVKKAPNEEEDEGDWPAKGYGKYSYRIALPENVQFEKIKAEVKDGVLYITIPKASVSSKVLDINVQ